MNTRRAIWWTLALALALPVPILARAGNAGPAVTPEHATVSWKGGPVFTGNGMTSVSCPANKTCDSFTVTTNVPTGYWKRHPGGVTFRIDWQDPNSVLELAVYDEDGASLGFSGYGRVNYQQIYLAAPPNAQYRVEIVNYAGADASYTGTAQLVEQRIPLARQSDPSGQQASGGGMRFTRALADPQILTADPSIAVDPQGRVYVTSRIGEGNPSGSFLWRSLDRARTFQLVGDGVAGWFHDPRYRPCATAVDAAADIDLTADRNGRLYLADVGTSGVTAGFSRDYGRTWFCAPVPSSTGSDDRPWLTPAPSADGTGPAVDAYLLYQAGAFVGELPGTSTVMPEQLRVAMTRDGGITWVRGGAFAIGKASIPGEFFAGPDGRIYEVFSADNAVWVAESRDEGRTFAVRRVSQRLGDPRGDGWTAGGVDSKGVLYAAWVDQGSWAVLYSRSTDSGRHWSVPVQVSPPGTTAMKVWMATGRAGDVAITWYGARGTFPLYATPAATRWDVWAARSMNASSENPAFWTTKVTNTPVGFGPEREINNASVSASLSAFGDHLRAVIAPGGGLLVSYADLGYAGANNAAYVVVARQVSGPGMSPNTASTAASTQRSAAQSRCPQLRFTSSPSVTQKGGYAELSFTLASTADLARALATCRQLEPRRDATWVAVWKTEGHRQYAGFATQSAPVPPPTLRFFGGLDPTQVAYPGLTATAASYPGTMALSGAIDDTSRRVTIRVPMHAYGLTRGALMHDVQLFSMVGLEEVRTPQNIFRLVHSTPSVSLRIGQR